ncbi:MAG: efflux RND transporter periplasmic adaptor subunit, partial [Candidatus Binatia bacterium]
GNGRMRSPAVTFCARYVRRQAVVVGVLLALAACSPESGGRASGQTRAGQHGVVPVSVASVVQREVPVQLRAIGTVEPFSTVSIKSRVEGQLLAVHFHEGQPVHKGDLLFTVDPRPFKATLRQAEANLARDVAEAKNAAADAKRRTRLFARGFVSKDEYDQARTAAAARRAVVNADRATVDNARLRLQYCYIRSPMDGRVGQLLVHEGNVVKKNDTTLAVINQLHPVYVAFSVPEQQLPVIRQRAAATTLQVQAFAPPHNTHPALGRLSFINNAVDTRTGTILLKGRFANDDETLWPGQFVDVALTLGTRTDALLVPAQAIQTGQQGQYVFVVTPDLTAEVRPVVTGERIGQEVIVAKGLAPGERVVTDGQIRLAAGFKVQLKHEGGTGGRTGGSTAVD